MSKVWIWAAVCAMASMTCVAQVPDGGSALVVATPTSVKIPERPTHKFFDRTNLGLTAMTFSAALADGITTQHALAMHRSRTVLVNGVPTNYSVGYVEKNPIAAPLVNRGWSGQLAATAITAGVDLGVRNWLHRKGHHKIERVVPFLFAATSASFAAHNAKYW